MASEENNRGGFVIQQYYCERNGSPIYGRMCAAIARALTRESEVGARILDWPGEPTRDALPLRFIGGLHALVLAGKDAALADVFSGKIADPAGIERVLLAVVKRHNEALLPWLDGPPQTNEPGRSGPLMLGLLDIARATGAKLDIMEIGSSAGLNLLIDRYRIDLGGTIVGPADASVTIAPEWSGPAPAPAPVEIVRIRGCDVNPMDATDPAIAARLAAYIWAEEPRRLVRVQQAIAMMRERGVSLERADAADWVEARLAEPQEAGVARVLMHSVVWQYLPEPVAERIRVAMRAAGARATAERPLGWVSMEPDRALGHQVIRARNWPGDGAWRTLGTSHAHGKWVDAGLADERGGIDLPAAARVVV